MRVRVDALDAAGVRLLGARVDAIARQLKLGKLPPDPLQVELVMSSASGDQLTRGVSRAVRKT